MVCIYCGQPTQVTNSRLQKRSNQVWRRRHCQACGNTFTTHEAADLSSVIMVEHTPQQLVPFSREILFVSIYESCKHRTTAIDDAAALTQTVISKLSAELNDGVLNRSTITKTTAGVLQRFDPVAATVYHAYHG